jgi:aspartate carbamoyltransferase regulatory subunit
MSSYTPITLNGKIRKFKGYAKYGINDGTQMSDNFQTYKIVINNIQPQNLGDASTPNSYLYNGLDIRTNMYISDAGAQTILKIETIKYQTPSTIEVLAKDINMMSYRLNNGNTIATSADVIIFDINDNGEALIADTSKFNPKAINLIQSRFDYNKKTNQIKFTHFQAPDLVLGDIVTIDSNGNLVRHGSEIGVTQIKIGTVIDKLRAGKDIFIKPFNNILTNYQNPEALTGNPGSKYYKDSKNPGKITLNNNNAGEPLYLQLNNRIKTTIIANNNALPDVTKDIVKINDVVVYDYNTSNSLSTLSEWVNLINSFSSQTHVVASNHFLQANIQSDVNKLAFPGYWEENDVFIAISEEGKTPTHGEIKIGDGNKKANVIFDSPDKVIAIGGTNYNIMSPTAIKNKIKSVVDSTGMELNVELINLVNGVGKGIKINTINNATQIYFENVNSALFNKNILGNPSWIGISSNTLANGDSSVPVKEVEGPYLALERNSGGTIKITGEPISGGYINNAGIVSSSNGRIPYLLDITHLARSNSTYALKSYADTGKIPNNTNGDYEATGITISNKPFKKSRIDILVNGISVQLGNGTRNAPCYFSPPGDGSFARAIGDVQKGDELFWVASQIGYNLENSDVIDIEYQIKT